ncbi:MAG: hypothetical protein V4819_03835 [Verrucomicrobiota bacterium]
MKANPDQPAGPRLKAAPTAKHYTKSHKASAVGPPARRKTWFSSYDEEWAAFLAESAMRKSRPGINSEDPEALPRVWNIPHV